MSERAKESVWDYPRPPRIEAVERRVRVEHGGELVAESARALRVLETASPPTIYVPAEDVRTELLSEVASKHTQCEWKSRAHYFHLEVGGARAEAAAWSYPMPRDGFAALRGQIAFYAGRVDACSSATSASARRAAASTAAGSPTRSRALSRASRAPKAGDASTARRLRRRSR